MFLVSGCFFALRQLNVEVIKKGAAQPFVTNSDLASMKIIYPDGETLTALQRTIELHMELLEFARQDSHTLSTQRDALLPRLVSGEMRVAEFS